MNRTHKDPGGKKRALHHGLVDFGTSTPQQSPSRELFFFAMCGRIAEVAASR
jgi:hypothetical protein